MIHHSHHVQIPPSHHHHVTVSVKNYRKELLNCRKTKVGRKCIAIIIPLAVLSAILCFGLKFLSGPGDLGHVLTGADDFSPYTSLMFPVSGLYCDSYSMTKYSGSPAATLSWNTSMYIMKNIPKLSTRHNFSIHREGQNMITLKPGEFYQWSFILHIDSWYEINSCVLGGSDIELLVIIGEAVFNEWVVAGGCSGCIRYYLQPCNLTTEQKLAHTISRDDKYYFVYLSSRANHQVSHIQSDMSFTMFEYLLDETEIYCQCSCTDEYDHPEYYACSSCGLPLTFNGYVLLRTTPINDHSGSINWEHKIYISWSCDASYNAYLLLYCLPLIVTVVVVLVCIDIMPSLCKRKKSDSNAASDTEQPISPRCACTRKVLVALLWFLIVLLISLISVCAMLLALTLILGVVSIISGGIPGFTSSKLKLGLLAVSTILFVVSILCNKLKEWIQDKLHALTKMIVRRYQIGQSHQTSTCNTNDTNSTTSRSDIKDHLRNQILKLFCIFLWLPIVIICIASISAAFTFLEAFFPVLTTYSSETDSDIFIPGDTQAFSFNSFFCSGYSISSYGSSHLSASLYVANSESVAGNHSITYISSNESVRSSVNAMWNFYLNEKSTASMKACLFENDPIENTMLDLYKYDTFSTNRLRSYDISDSCYGVLLPLPIGKRSGKAGKYSIVLSTKSTNSMNVYVEIKLNRFVYSIDHVVSSAQICSVSSHTSDTCTAIAPGSAGSMTGLISAYSDQTTIDWHETLSITKTCHYHMATWTALWLPVLLINIAIFSIVYGAVHIAKFRQLQKKPSQEETTESDNEPLINHNANNINYGTNDDVTAPAAVAIDTIDPAGGRSADAGQASYSDPEPVHTVVGVGIEHPSNETTSSIGPSGPIAIEISTEHPSGDINIMPTSESDPTATDSAVKVDKSFADASIGSTSDSKDEVLEKIEPSTAIGQL